MKLIRNLFLAAFMISVAMAQPVITSVGNGASYTIIIARGSMMIVKGTGLGANIPASQIQTTSFPFMTELNGGSASITVNGVTTQGLMYYTWNLQSAFIVPSATPVGTGTVTFTYNGQTSAPFPITVVDSNVGFYSADSSGTGLGIGSFHESVGNGANTGQIIGTSNAANPGDLIILWANGLGPVSYAENMPALGGNMPEVPLQLFIGGQQVETIYHGRAGCCSSVDVIFAYWPSGIQNTCATQVYAIISGRTSNTVEIPSADGGRICSNPGDSGGGILDDVVTSQTISQMLSNGTSTILNGSYDISKDVQVSDAGGQIFTNSFESEDASFQAIRLNFAPTVTAEQLRQGLESFVGGRPGTCMTQTYSGFSPPSPIDPSQFGFSSLDLGTVMASSSSFGSKTFDKQQQSGFTAYELEFTTGELKGAGSITTSASGSASIGPWTTTSPGVNFVLNNPASLQRVNRSGISASWQPLANGLVTITITTRGNSFSGPRKEITCWELASRGTINVPGNIASYLDVTDGLNNATADVTYAHIHTFQTSADLSMILLTNSYSTSTDVD